MDDLRECYRLLEVEPGASPEELKRAYRDLVKVWHPDRFADDPRLQSRAQEKLKQINLAYGKTTETRIVWSRPPVTPVPRRPEPPVWTPGSGPAPGGGSGPSEADPPPPRRKRNWEPTLVRCVISLLIVFQIAATVAIVTVIKNALSDNAVAPGKLVGSPPRPAPVVTPAEVKPAGPL